MSLPEDPHTLSRWLVDRLGPHPATRLGIDLDGAEDDATLVRWLIATCLHAPRADESVVRAAYAALADAGLDDAAWLQRDPSRVHALLEQAGHPRSEATALLLSRVLGSLQRDHEGSPTRLLTGADSLEMLGGSLSRLAPGFGRAAVTRFLQPLRDEWPVCAELPLDPAAVAAGIHLGLLPEGVEPETAAGSLRRAAPRDGDGPALRDLEAALAHLGRRACQRERSASCPLGDDCPLA